MVKRIAAALAALSLCLFGASSVRASGNQQSTANSATLGTHTAPRDGNGVVFREAWQVGYKVFESSNSTSAALVKDESGTAPTCGIVHQVCIDAGTGFVVAVDSAGVASVTDNSVNSIIGQMEASSTAQVCQVFDAQFQNGLVVKNSSVNAGSHIYWRKCGGGAQ